MRNERPTPIAGPDVRTLIYRPRPVDLGGGPFRRVSTRPTDQRGPEFDRQFDDTTLLFDSFFVQQNEVLVTAPPFLNLQPYAETMRIVAAPSGRPCAFRIRTLDRHAQIRITVPADTARIALETGMGCFDVEPRDGMSDFFAGRRVIFTMSKNNRREWIQDWVRYHRDVHGANAVLFYDNQSDAYSNEELLASLAEISGIDRICVVQWPFRYGPQGLDARRFWDSDFCQSGAWEHARWMFLQSASSVMNADIDELVVSNDGSSVFEAAERSWTGIVRYYGHWVHGFRERTRVATADAPIRVFDFDHYLQHTTTRRWGLIPRHHNRCAPKWTVVPARCPDRGQWTAHRIKNCFRGLVLSRNFYFRHYREIGNHWKYDRSSREPFDDGLYLLDQQTIKNFAGVRWTS
jgi:hypothetical protein